MASRFERRPCVHIVTTLAAVILATRLGGAFGFPPTGISTFWPPNAILLAALLMMVDPYRKRCFLLAYPAYVITEMWIGFSFTSSIIFAAANCLEVAVAIYVILRLTQPPFDLGHLRQLLVILSAFVVSSPLGGLIGASGVALSGGPFGETFLRWFLADFVGFLVFAPLVLTLPAWRDWSVSAPTSARVEAALAAATLLGLSLTVYGPANFWDADFYGTQFLPIPVMLWVALRFGPKGAAVSSLGVSVVAISYAINGFGPFSHLTPDDNVESLQLFITSLVLATTVVAVLTKERDLALTRLAESRDRLKELIEERTNELVVSQDRFQTLVESAPVCIHEIDREGKLISMNAAGLRMMGAEKEAEVCGINYIDVPVPEDREHVAELMDRAWLGQGSEFEFRAFGKTGLLYFSSCFEPIKDDEGNVVRLMGVTADITERRRSEQALREARDHANAANQAKSRFLSNMSHELRTPLNAIIGFSEIIKEEKFGPIGNSRYSNYAGDIHASGLHLLGLINDLLDLSKIESGEEELHEETVDVDSVVESAVGLVKRRAEQGEIELQVDLQKELPEFRADRRKVIQILVNLLSNSLKFTETGGTVKLKVWSRGESGLIFQIIDTGIGMALEDIPKALSEFTQVDTDLNRKYEGTGLGLPLTKGLIELHGGSLDLQSQVGVGTTATVRFPPQRLTVANPAHGQPKVRRNHAG